MTPEAGTRSEGLSRVHAVSSLGVLVVDEHREPRSSDQQRGGVREPRTAHEIRIYGSPDEKEREARVDEDIRAENLAFARCGPLMNGRSSVPGARAIGPWGLPRASFRRRGPILRS